MDNGYGNCGYQLQQHHHVVDLNDDSPSLMVSTTSSSPVIGNGVGVGYIEHHVSRMDTLAGVAIKYGVEVSDIKKLNSLVTDLQMFALKTIQIPLPGRHPPSPCLSNGSDSPGYERTPPSRAYPEFLDSFQSLKVSSSVSPTVSSLQGFYGLKSTEYKRNLSEGFEMACYKKEEGPFPKQLLAINPPLSRHRKSKSMANGDRNLFTKDGQRLSLNTRKRPVLEFVR